MGKNPKSHLKLIILHQKMSVSLSPFRLNEKQKKGLVS